ncbi:hypothetical protein EMIT048CA2_60022 [Pseudomonas chlororaphis]
MQPSPQHLKYCHTTAIIPLSNAAQDS